MTTGKSTRPSDLPLLIVTTSPSTSNSSSSGNRSGIKFNSSKNCNGNSNGHNDDTMKSQRGVRVVTAEKYFTADHAYDNSTTSSLGHDESHNEDDDDDDDDDGPITATNKTKNQNQNLTELAFLSKLDQSLLSAYNSSSDESSYWSTSDDDDDSDDDEEDNDDDDEEDNESEDDNDHEDNGQEGLEASREDPSNYLDSTDDMATDAAVEDVRDVNHQRRPRSSNNINHNNNNSKPKRNDSVMSLDALLKLSMQLGDIKKPSTPIAVSKEARRRGRRLNKEHTVTSLGALARKVGSSTNNDLRDDTTSGLTFRRCESATNIPKKSSNITSSSANHHATNNKKFFLHIQQQGSPVKGGATVALEPTVVVPATKTKSPTDDAPPPAVVIRKSTLAKYGDFATHVVPPRDHYVSLLKKAGIQPVVLMPYDKLDHFFVPNTLKDRAAFDMELVQCIRDQNLTKLQELHTRGHHMSARAQCGESILHICARRGTPDMLRYLLDVAKVSPRVCCDYGRTPLHDAAWSTDAKSLKMMHILITACPDLLLILDKRGFMPLDYIPKDRWPHCCAFLDKHKDSLLPTGVLFGDDDEEDDDDSEEDDENDDDRSDTDSNLDF